MLAEVVSMDLSQLIGGAGTGIGGVIATFIWRAYARWVKSEELRAKLIQAQIADLAQQSDHRTAETTHWGSVIEHHSQTMEHRNAEETALSAIKDDVRIARVRLESGKHAAVAG